MRPRSPLPSEGENPQGVKSSFWKWTLVVAAGHLVLLLVFLAADRSTPPVPPPSFISLLESGSLVQGSPKAAQAPQAAPRPAERKASPRPEIRPVPEAEAEPSEPVAIQPPPRPNPVKPKLVKPKPIAKPKVKVDLTEASVAAPTESNPTPPKTPSKPKVKKTRPAAENATANLDEAARAQATPRPAPGLSAAQVEAELGSKLKAEGSQAESTGVSGSPQGQANPFSGFYAALRNQALNNWEHPPLPAGAAPVMVRIHVDPDNHVPPARVVLLRSSGNAAYDESALAAARTLGYLQEPLPAGCSPDITINFTLN